MTWQTVVATTTRVFQRHREIFMLYAYMLVVTMRPQLHWPFNRIPPLEWLYEWQHDALRSLFEKMRPDLQKKISTESVEVQTTIARTPPVEDSHK